MIPPAHPQAELTAPASPSWSYKAQTWRQIAEGRRSEAEEGMSWQRWGAPSGSEVPESSKTQLESWERGNAQGLGTGGVEERDCVYEVGELGRGGWQRERMTPSREK